MGKISSLLTPSSIALTGNKPRQISASTRKVEGARTGLRGDLKSSPRKPHSHAMKKQFLTLLVVFALFLCSIATGNQDPPASYTEYQGACSGMAVPRLFGLPELGPFPYELGNYNPSGNGVRQS